MSRFMPFTLGHGRLARLAGLALLAAALLWGCGGVGTGGTGDYADSHVTGFGSVIVGGVEFDDAAATVLDDDGNALARNGNELRLGMTLEVGGTGDVALGQGGEAQTVRIATTVLGPVEAVDAAAQTMTVLGQSIEVRGWTVFGPPWRGGLSALRVGDVVAVYGYADATSGRTLATRVENAPGSRVYRLRGIVNGLDTAARTLRIGGVTLSYANAADVPAALANGQLVRVRLPARGNAAGALAIEAFSTAASRPTDADSALVDGLVTSVASATSFSVNGMPVDASQAVVEPAGTAVSPGRFVSVRGRISAGTLVATHVQVFDAAAIDAREYQVAGVVSALDAAAQTFVVRNVEVDYSGASFVRGTAGSLANGTAVRVEGPLSADGSQLKARVVTVR